MQGATPQADKSSEPDLQVLDLQSHHLSHRLRAQRSSGIPSVMRIADDDRQHNDWTANGKVE